MGIHKKINANRAKVLGVIPARFGSTRFPGKPLADICGKPMIQWVYEQAVRAETLGGVLVATDDPRISDAVKAFGGSAVMTSPAHPTGTDRLAEVAGKYPNAEVIINIQGDEPLIDPSAIDAVAKPLLNEKKLFMSTACAVINDPALIASPHAVKVVLDKEGYALYFSRSPIPYFRRQNGMPVYKHLGLYGYRRNFLLKYAKTPPSPLEGAESLEQLRALYYGFRIKVVLVEEESLSVDTPEDLLRVRSAIGGLMKGRRLECRLEAVKTASGKPEVNNLKEHCSY
ncbi:MAG: 3-deoxy-manno-octulosonate cytidylyltransferase [Bacillota bacterium]